ncbi:hypothetical protein ASF72_19130 [Arthrobacter sp. Leaf141]|uniref:condensation domain-containing protein n=1 Tax=Arthrobacter sp. Leaf141 TaxID=1736273 RepID=UPI0006F9B451|nr:condensation domain-containing protein [Arthrobacter sp. Leaf141]KQQ96208.1 hypothetical protein ASF72_19130 [Arthrobacter sp. Leaf141]
MPPTDSAFIPLTPAQGRIWADQQLRPGSAFYNINRVVEVEGALDVPRLEDAVTLVCAAHDSLRFRFGEAGGVPHQNPVPVMGADVLRVCDVSATEEPERETQRLVRQEQLRPMDLVKEGPLRVLAVQIAADRHVLLFQTHHIVSDWWGGGVFVRALSRAYNDGVLPRDPQAQFQGYIEAQLANDRQRIHADTAALAAYLAPGIQRLNLPYSVDPAVARRSGGSVQLSVRAENRARLARQAAAGAASEYMFLLAALSCVLQRWTGSEEFTIGVYVADRSTPATADMIGLLFEGLPVRIAVDSTTTFAEVLAQVRDGVLMLLTHPTADPEELARELGGTNSGMATLFDVTFQMYPARTSVPRLGTLRTRGNRLVQETLHDLMAYAHEGPDGLELRLQYDASLLHEDAVTAVLAAWRSVLIAAALNPAIPVADLDLSIGTDNYEVGSRTEGARTEDATSLLLELTRVLKDNPGRAVLFDAEGAVEPWTADQLAVAIDCAAEAITGRVSPGNTVALLAPVGPMLIVAWLALLRSGVMTLVLDPNEPAERFRYMLRDSGAQLLVCDADSPALAFVPEDLPRLRFNELAEHSDGFPRTVEATLPEADDDKPAALVYTSGSTGRPKGVILSRSGLYNQALHRIDLLGLAPGVGTGITLSAHFVTFPLEVLSALLSTAPLTLFPRRLLQSPADLLRSPGGQRLEIAELSVAGLDALLYSIEQTGQTPDLPRLRTVLVAGEKLRPQLAHRFSRCFPGIHLVNAYGMTETSGMVASRTVTDPAAFTEGEPTRNCVLEVVDQRGRVIPRGWAGELRVSGRQVAIGYWRKPGLTAERFGVGLDGRSVMTGDLARMTSEGTIEILGRMDDQLSLRGFRIEPTEISRTIEAHPAVTRAEVALWPVPDGDGYLVAYLLTNREVPQAELREHCMAHLPPAMVPRQFVRVEEYPRGRTGKLDARLLPAPAELTTPARPPSSPLELVLAAIWRDVLGVQELSLDSDFFEIGGQSLAAVRVVARIHAILGIELNANAVFEHPTLELLARRISSGSI